VEGHIEGGLEAGLLIGLLAGEPDLDGHVEQERQVGTKTTGRERLQLAQSRQGEAAAVTLVGERGVGMSGVQDEETAGQRRPDDLGHELRTRCAEQQRIGPRIERRVVGQVVQEDAADALADRRAARLASGEGLDPERLQGGAEPLRHQRLARAIGTLHGDEPPAPGPIVASVHGGECTRRGSDAPCPERDSMPPMSRLERLSTPRARRRSRLGATIAGIGLALAVPALVDAHPLGNFTVNHYAGIRVEADRVIVDVVIDLAEIPTFQEKLRIDTDGDGMVSDEEAEAERTAACPRLAPEVALTVGGRSMELVAVAAGLDFPPGAAGLETMRLVCTYTAGLPAPLAPGTALTFSDRSNLDRVGWREVTVTGSGVTIGGDLPGVSVSNRLTAYPSKLLSRPLQVGSVTFTASPGGSTLDPLSVPETHPLPGAAPLYPMPASAVDRAVPGAGSAIEPAVGASTASIAPGPAVAGGAVPGGVGADVAGLLGTEDLTPLVLVGSLVAAMALGAGHALTPGHGKTLMGAYLVGTRGTAVHAIALGLSVTVSHTLGIVVLAAIVVGLRGVLPPETFDRLAPIASGLLVLGIGTWLVLGQLRDRLAPSGVVEDDQANGHGASEHGHAHDHSRPAGGTPSLTWRSLFILGLAGGIIPSTNALIILLATIASGRAAFGLVLVVAFGLGMAAVLAGTGLGLVLARDRLANVSARPSLARVAGYAPLAAGLVVFSLGIYLTTQAVGVGPTL
jgi:nickel/cobalt transporter (NicO) family protein